LQHRRRIRQVDRPGPAKPPENGSPVQQREQQPAPAITHIGPHNMWPTLDSNQPSRRRPVAPDQMVSARLGFGRVTRSWPVARNQRQARYVPRWV